MYRYREMIPDKMICKNLHIYVTRCQNIVAGTRGKIGILALYRKIILTLFY